MCYYEIFKYTFTLNIYKIYNFLTNLVFRVLQIALCIQKQINGHWNVGFKSRTKL